MLSEMSIDMIGTLLDNKCHSVSASVIILSQCGGCWAFSVVGAVESVCAIKGQPLEALSVQQVIDCSYSNYGCNGGSPLSALYWLNKVSGSAVFFFFLGDNFYLFSHKLLHGS